MDLDMDVVKRRGRKGVWCPTNCTHILQPVRMLQYYEETYDHLT